VIIKKFLKTVKDNDLHLWVFATGAIVLVIEVVAVRILAPYFGNTLFSVSSVLSVVLLALSAGYWVGGNMADKNPKREIFYGIILASGGLLLLMEVVRNLVLEVISRYFSISIGPLLAATVLFIGPAFLLGMLSPFAIKLKSIENKEAGIGRVTGGIFFWSTLGSISGSLSAGFLLIPFFGVNVIMLSIGAILIIMGATPLLFRKYFSTNSLVVLLLGAGSLFVATLAAHSGVAAGVLYQADGIYEQITVREGTYNGRSARFLLQDRNNSAASFMNSDELVYDYTKYYSLYEVFDTTLERALVIGGGAYSIPEALLNEPTQPIVDVSEVEPSLYGIAQEYFGVQESDRLNNYLQDGRRFLSKSENKYDVIYGDVYQSTLSIPSHFTTVEFFELVRDRLTDDGVFISNVVGDQYQGPDAFFLSEMKTFRSVFPNSFFFAVRSPDNKSTQNIMMAGILGDGSYDIDYEKLSSSENPILSELESHVINPEKFDLDQHQLITDNHAPIDYLILKQLERRGGAY